MSQYDPRYLRGIELFNECEFFESHEAWEELWADTQGPDREFYQGLIQAAVALHHFVNGNLRGARKVFSTCCSHLQPYRPKHLGLDLEQFLAQLRECFAPLLEREELPQGIEIDPDKIPEIHLNPAPEAHKEGSP